jgi:ATP-dependent DNA helicase RecQ
VRSLAEQVGRVGRLPIVDALSSDGLPGDADLSARARAQVQAGRVALIPGTSLVGETVLLIDDAWRSGWTATIAGALLREAGAEHVLPLVIQQRP